MNKEDLKEEIICKKCKTSDFHLEDKTFRNGTKHIQATCNICKERIKYVSSNKEIKSIPFGKYKDVPLKEIMDIKYLNWVTVNVKMSKNFKTAVEKRIEDLKGEPEENLISHDKKKQIKRLQWLELFESVYLKGDTFFDDVVRDIASIVVETENLE